MSSTPSSAPSSTSSSTSSATRPKSPNWQQLDRAGWLLWGVTFLLLLGLTITIPALYLPLSDILGSSPAFADIPLVREPVTTLVALVGLVLLFCLYTVTKQREIILMRTALERQEHEREDVESRLGELSALFQASTTLQLQLRLDLILEIIVRRVVSTLKAQQASIMILDPEAGELVTRASYGLEAEYSRGTHARIGEGIAGWVAMRNEAVLLGETPPNEELGKRYRAERTITSALSLPLALGDRVVGVLNVNRIRYSEPFRDDHLDVLRVFGDHIAAVIDRAEMMERLGTRNRELEANVEELAELNRMKDVFLATASHELKTPLSSVIAYAELLGDQEDKLTRDQTREFVGRLRGEAQRLLGLVDDILDLSRLESGKMPLKMRFVSVNEIATAAIDTTRALAKKYGIEVRADLADGLPRLSLDEVKIRQVVVNLLVNGIKFSPRGSTVGIRTLSDGRFLRIEVSDVGPGIAPETALHIFELFGQGAGADGEGRNGLGLGLHLVKRLSELHGGHVGVQSRPEEGSTFWVRLPIASAEPGEAGLAEAA
jgi:signal transduction histidine kinase